MPYITVSKEVHAAIKAASIGEFIDTSEPCIFDPNQVRVPISLETFHSIMAQRRYNDEPIELILRRTLEIPLNS